MGTLLKLLYAPVEPFGGHPERFYMMAGLFGLLFLVSFIRSAGFRPAPHIVILVTAVLWGLGGLNETIAMASGANIRIDILFGWPFVLFASIAAVWATITTGGDRPRDQHQDASTDKSSPV